MRRTYAPTGIFLGLIIGIVASVSVEKSIGSGMAIFVAIIVGVGLSAVFWFLIKFLENIIYTGTEKGKDFLIEKVGNAIQRSKDKKSQNNTNENHNCSFCGNCGNKVSFDDEYCERCRTKLM